MGSPKTLPLRWKNLRWQVPVEEILYADSYQRHVVVHTARRTYEVVGKLTDLQEALDASTFVRTHQSFLVNMNYIADFLCDEVVLFDGTHIPVSARKRPASLKRYDAWLQRADLQPNGGLNGKTGVIKTGQAGRK